MRKPIIAGNWKMFKTRDEAIKFILDVNDKMPSNEVVDSVICSQFTVLRCLVKRQGENLRIGAQNMHFKDEGAYTGEVSGLMLKSIGTTYVIIGHSERRAMFNETDETVNLKLKKAFEVELLPILCVGESLEQRETGKTEEVLKNQIVKDLEGLTKEQVKELVIAYEPIWAIGTGKTATPEIAQNVHHGIREFLKTFNAEVADGVRILYGGSCNAKNAADIFAQPDVDGGLIGGASLKAPDFTAIIEAAGDS